MEKFTVTDFLDLGTHSDARSQFRYDLRSSGPDATSVRVYPDEITKSNE